MRTTTLGQLTVSAQGLGCMGMSEWYGATDWDESIATIHRALDLGVTFIDTADIYGAGHNERQGSRHDGASGLPPSKKTIKKIHATRLNIPAL